MEFRKNKSEKKLQKAFEDDRKNNEFIKDNFGYSPEELNDARSYMIELAESRELPESISSSDIEAMSKRELVTLIDLYTASEGSSDANDKEPSSKLNLRDRINAKLIEQYFKIMDRGDARENKAKGLRAKTKELWNSGRRGKAMIIGGAAIVASLSLPVKAAFASKLANTTGVSADIITGVESMGHVGGGTFSLDQAGATSPTTPGSGAYDAAFGTSPDPESLAKEVQGTTPNEYASAFGVSTTPSELTQEVQGKSASDNIDSLVKEVERTTGVDVADTATPTTPEDDKIDIVGGVTGFVEDAKDKIEDALGVNTAEAATTDSGTDTGADSSTDKSANYNRNEQNSDDRMSTEGAFDGDDRGPKRLDDHVLAKIENNPTLMAAVLEVRESGSMDANFSLDDVNKDNASYAVGGEHGTYSEKGEKALETLKHTWDNGEQGKLLSQSEVSKLMEHYTFINHGVDAGGYENAIDNKMYGAGAFDYRPDLGDQIYAKELGNGHTVYFKVNEQDPSRDCLNVQTLAPRPEEVFTPTPEGTPSQPSTEYTPESTGGGSPDEDSPETSTTSTSSGGGEEGETDETTTVTGGDTTTEKHPKDPTKAPQGHDNGDHLAPAPTTVTPDANANGVSGGSTEHPGATETAPGAAPEKNTNAPEAQPGTNTPGAKPNEGTTGEFENGEGNNKAVGEG